MEDLDVAEIADPPPCIEQSPAQLDLLVAVEELGEVAADLVIGDSTDDTGATEEVGDVTTDLGGAATGAGDVPAGGAAVLVDEPQRHRAQLRVGGERLHDLGGAAPELRIVVEEADERLGRRSHAQIAPTGYAEVELALDQSDVGRAHVQRAAPVADDDDRRRRIVGLQGGDGRLELGRPVARGQHDPPKLSTADGHQLHGSCRTPREVPIEGCRRPAGVIGIIPGMSTPTAVAPPAGMRDAHETAKLGPYLRELRARRSYLWYVSANELRSRQITSVLGNLWHLLNPALSIAVYYVIFGLLLQTTRGVQNFFLFLTIGLFLFQYTQKATTEGAKSIVANTGLIKAIRFPRALLPITSTVTETLASLSTFAVMYVVALSTGEPVTWRWLMFPGLVAVMFVFNMGAAMVAARMTTHFRDTTQILPFLFRLLLYGSGVIFSVDAYAENPTARALFTLNPMYCFITLGRWCLMAGNLRVSLLVSALVWTVVLAAVGFVWFRAAEERYARD
jgi:teichoic acid transport system permease protein